MAAGQSGLFLGLSFSALLRAMGWVPTAELTEAESASTLFRFFRSQHVKDLKLIFTAALFVFLSHLAIVLLVGVGTGLPSGMLFKIVPFLCWFHLQQHQVATGRFEVRVPHMHGFLPEGLSRWQWGLHLAALVTLTAACVEPRLTAAGGMLLALAGLLLAGLTLTAAWRYRRTLMSLRGPPPEDT